MISKYGWISRFLFCKVTHSTQSQNTRERLLKFPYSFLNQKIINRAQISDTSDFLHQNFLEDATAFASINEKNPNVLRGYYKKLFNEEYKSGDQLAGEAIFSKYIMSNLAFIKNVIKNSTNKQQISYNLKKVFFFKDFANRNSQLTDIDFKNIQNNGILAHKAYLLNIYEGSPKFLSFLQKFFEQYKKAEKQNQIQAAFVILAIPQFYRKLPQSICEYSINLIAENLPNMDDWQIYRAISFIFMSEFPATKKFADAVMKNMLKQINQENVQAKIPLFHKVIKLRDKLKMSSAQLQKYIIDNPLRFNNIFLKKKINKQPFLDVVATKDSHRYLPEQIKIQFINYIFKIFNDTIQEQQCDSEELIEAIKLTLKFYYNFNAQKTESLIAMFEDHLIPMFEQDNQISFWLITLLLRMDKQKIKKPQILKTIKKVQKQYHEKYLQSKQFMQRHKNLQKILQIYYHFARASIPIEKVSTIKEYDFRHVTTFQQVIYACYLITKIDLPPSDKLAILQRMVPRITELIQAGRLKNIKNIFLILTFVQSANCPQLENSKPTNFLLSKLQTAYMNLLAKENQCPPSYSLNFLKKVYRGNINEKNQKKQVENILQQSKVQRYQFHKFIAFINSCLKNPNNFKLNYEEYKQKVGPKPGNKTFLKNKGERKKY